MTPLTEYSIGIHEDKIGEGKDIKAGGLHLKEFKGLWIPNQYYFTYETLPKKWETIINRKDVVNPLAIKEEIKGTTAILTPIRVERWRED